MIIHGRSNSCSFVINRKKHLILYSQNLLTRNKPRKLSTLVDDFVMFFVIMEVPLESPIVTPGEVQLAFQEFRDVFLKDLPDLLPSLRNIQHVIDLIRGSSLPNLSHYRMNPTEHASSKDK